MRTVRVAAAQMLVEGGEVEANLSRAEVMVEQAAAAGCDVVVLPECLDVGWTHPAARSLAEAIPGTRTDRLGAVAARHAILVAAGVTERCGDEIYNAAVLLDRDGSICLLHRKVNVMDIAQCLYSIGDRVQVTRTHLGVLGLNICADNFPNAWEIGNTIGRLGAHLLLSPSAWAVDADYSNELADPYGAIWRDSYGRLARQFKMPVVGASNVGQLAGGPWAGRRCIGCSLIVNSDGVPVAVGPADEPALVMAEVQLYDQRPRGTEISGTL
jgi:predicted amidohydrolase